ncbi:outer membrane protein assembly factor BamB family protein [Streptosporangium sandarakinum]
MIRARAVLLALLAALLPMAAQPASAAGRDTPAYQTYGPASLTGAIVGAAVADGKAYVVTRGQKPPVVAEIDLATRKVIRTATLPDGPAAGEPEGGWATVVSGGKVYIGTYPVPDLYSFDPATGEVAHLRSFGANGGFVWSLAAAPDGTLYLGTYPKGRVWEYVPSTGAVRDFGVLTAGERYVRAVAADDTTVYAGLLDKGKLVAIDRATGAVRELAQGPTGIGAIALGGDRVYAASGGVLIDTRRDGTDTRMVDTGLSSFDALAVAPDGTVYITSRPDGAVHAYRNGTVTKIAEPPSPGDETRRLVLDGQTLTGFAGSGGMWRLDLSTAESRFTDLIEAGLPAGSERPQSMLLVPNRALYVGGHFWMDVRDLRTGEKRRFRVPGEPKDLVRRGNMIYAAMYPSGEIISIDIRDDSVHSLGFLGHGQQRPWDLEYDEATDRLLVASAPLGAALEGALSVVDPDTGKMDVYPGVIRDESLMSLSVDSGAGIVYLGGDVLGGGGTPPTRTSASIAAFDLRSRTVLWEAEPLAGNRTIQDIKVHDGLLYVLYKRNSGTWIALDLADRTIRSQGTLPGYGELTIHRGRVFAQTFFGGGNAYELGSTAKLLATGLGDEWYTNPQLHFAPGSWDAWTLIGRDLAKVRLDPRGQALTVSGTSS